jgi:N-acetylglucosamine kinase-like BadF-type ATPase
MSSSARHRFPAAVNGEIVVAIDGGGTRTRCVVADASGRVLGAGGAGPTNVVLRPPQEVKLMLEVAVKSALSEGGVRGDRVAAVAAGHAGVLPDGRNGRFVERHLKERFRHAPVAVTGDNVIALRGAIPSGAGVVVVAGTGSSVFGRSPAGEWVRGGGGGPILGDEGSAYAIALAGLRAAWRARDGRDRATSLTDLLARALKIRSFDDAVDAVHDPAMTRDRLAALGAVVASAGSAGDAAALDILRTAGRDLALAAASAVRRLGLPDGCVVSHAGPVFEAGGAFLESFGDTLRASCPGVDLRPPELPPVGGAFLLAVESRGGSAGEEVRRRFGAEVRRALSKHDEK